MQIQLNGEKKEIPEGLTLLTLIQHLALAPERLAVEHNLEVVRRTVWADTPISDGDRIEIVHFVGGGTGVGTFK